MVWGDNCGVSSKGLSLKGRELSVFASDNPKIEVFASVAFKYQPLDSDPESAASTARAQGFIPTTSGEATGVAPELKKIVSMSDHGKNLAIASGLSLANIDLFKPYISHALIASSVSVDDYHFDYEKLKVFVARAQA